MTEKLAATEKLARALEAEKNPALADMILKARVGDYDDYKSRDATPILNLIHDLSAHGLVGLVQRAMDGEFDGSREEADEWFAGEGKNLL